MLVNFNISHLDMIKQVLKEDGEDVDLFVKGVEVSKFSYSRDDVSYRLNISINKINDTDEILDFKLGNIKENNALAKKIYNNAYSNVSRLSNSLKKKINDTCPQLIYVTGELLLSEVQANKLMKLAIKDFGKLLKMNAKDRDTEEYLRLHKNASFIVHNENNYVDLADIIIQKQNMKNSLQFIYQNFKDDFNEQNISLLLLVLFSKWSYQYNKSLNYRQERSLGSKSYINFFIDNMQANPDKITPFFYETIAKESELELVEKVYNRIYTDFIKVTSEALEKKDVGEEWKNEVFIILKKCIESDINKNNFYKTFNNRGFENHLNNIFEMLELNQHLFSSKDYYKDITDFFIKNRLLDNKSITLEYIDEDIFIESKAPYKDIFMFSSKDLIELVPISFMQAKDFNNHNPFDRKYENDLAKFYLKVMSNIKDVFELATNVTVTECAIAENSLIMVLNSNEEINNSKLKKLFFEVIKNFNKYDTISHYSKYHEMELQSLIMKFDCKENAEKTQELNHKRKSVMKF